MVYDFHTHTVLSDGGLSAVELARRAIVNGYEALAITDHAAMGSLERILRELTMECDLIQEQWGLIALPGVELTHVPAAAIGDAAARAKELGAKIVIVHGETPVEPVEPGTNRAALLSPHVDLVAHPGLLTPEDAALAAERGTFLEVSARRGHSIGNGHVVRVAMQAGAALVVDSDAHEPEDLLTEVFAETVALGAGVDKALVGEVLRRNPHALLRKLGYSPA